VIRVKVKICGVRTFAEAEAAVEAGADGLGFNFWPASPRFIEPDAAREIIRELSPLVSSVGVFVNEQPERILEIASRLDLSAVQLHGDESPEVCAGLAPLKVIKALRVAGDFDLNQISEYAVDMVLLDTGVKGSYGGTGRSFDWGIAVEAKRLAPIILAGGLTVENITDAIVQVKPVAVDVCSGVEAEPGRKDFRKLDEFMAAVTRANAFIAGEQR
jgi:phosphoribosylanthranilate isomerase